MSKPARTAAVLAPAVAATVNHAAAVAYVVAGRASGLNNCRVAERHVPAKRRRERLPSLRKARGGMAAATAAGRIVVVIEGGPAPGLTYSDATEALRIDG